MQASAYRVINYQIMYQLKRVSLQVQLRQSLSLQLPHTLRCQLQGIASAKRPAFRYSASQGISLWVEHLGVLLQVYHNAVQGSACALQVQQQHN
jgi:hypothetical protein